MAKLTFYAAGAQLVAVPNQIPMIGVARQYVGRTFVPAASGKPASYPATKQGQSFDSDTPSGQHLIHEVKTSRRQGSQCLWCADAATAALCDVPFVEVEHDGGQWLAKVAAGATTTDDTGDQKPVRLSKTAERK